MILCCGEALIDMLPRQLSDGTDAYAPVPGGAIFNTAISLGRLGQEVGFFSSLSEDFFGEQLIEALKASNVDTTTCMRSVHPTTLAFVKLTDGQASYSFFDENSAGRNLASTALPFISDRVEALLFGAISLIPEPCGSAYETLMGQNADKVLMIDPNIRLAFIEDEAAHRNRIERMIARADIVKVSQEDLDWLVTESDLETHIEQWFHGNTKIVLVTRGENGVMAYTSAGKTQYGAHKIAVVDTIGAGDTFNAGFLAMLKRSKLLSRTALENIDEADLEKAITFASQVAAATCARAGADPPWQSELTKTFWQ